MRKAEYKFAFTLAEVLITLGIIGVIAAITIPAIIQSEQNKANEVAFKKIYSNISTAISQVTQENGGIPYKCYYWAGTYHDECGTFFNELKKKIQVITTYTGTVNGINIPNYIGTDLVSAQGGTVLNGSCNGGIESAKSNKTSWLLADGSMLISYSGTFSSALFIMDINGMKKPNKWGYDIFMINFGKNSKLEDDICGVYEKGGKRINNILIGN